jgi:DNA-binding YbaB/EbfC family protein
MNIAKMMQQATRMQGDMKSMQERLKTTTFDATLSGISVTVFGSGELKSLVIDPSLIDPAEKETLEDLIIAAVNQARAKMEEAVAVETKAIMGGLQLPPGFQLPF